MSEQALILRKRAAQLRHEADALIAGAVALEREAWGPNPLRGVEIVDHAFHILLEQGDQPYKHLAQEVEHMAQRNIAGKDPNATLLAAMHRDPRVQSFGDGVWGIKLGTEARRVMEKGRAAHGSV